MTSRNHRIAGRWSIRLTLWGSLWAAWATGTLGGMPALAQTPLFRAAQPRPEPLTPPAPTPALTPAAVPVSKARMPIVGDMLTIRTPGQPERRVRVLRLSGGLDDGLADLQDQTTNAVYSIPQRGLWHLAQQAQKIAATAPEATTPPRPASAVTPLPSFIAGPPRFSSSPAPSSNSAATATSPAPQWQPAKPTFRKPSDDPKAALPTPAAAKALMRETMAPPADLPPLIRPSSNTPATPVSAQYAAGSSSDPEPPTQAKGDSFRPAAIADRLLQAPRSGATLPAATLPAATLPAATLPPALPSAELVTVKPSAGGSMVLPPRINITPPEYVPVNVYDFGTTAPTTEVAQAAPAPAAPAAPAPESPVTTTRATPQRPQPTIIEEFTPAIQQTSLASPATVSPSAPSPTRIALGEEILRGWPAAIQAEVLPYVHDLTVALRPSVRERAVYGLAEGRYGSRPEIKAILARVALLDPAPSVRVVAIQSLSRLGYHETSYLEYLAACAESSTNPVRSAAQLALDKLRPR